MIDCMATQTMRRMQSKYHSATMNDEQVGKMKGDTQIEEQAKMREQGFANISNISDPFPLRLQLVANFFVVVV